MTDVDAHVDNDVDAHFDAVCGKRYNDLTAPPDLFYKPAYVSDVLLMHMVYSAMDVNVTTVTTFTTFQYLNTNTTPVLANLVPIYDECDDFVEKLRHHYYESLLTFGICSNVSWQDRVASILFPHHEKNRQALQRILKGTHPMSKFLPPINTYFGYNMCRSEYMGKSEYERQNYWNKQKKHQLKFRWGDNGHGYTVLGNLQENMLWFTLVLVSQIDDLQPAMHM